MEDQGKRNWPETQGMDVDMAVDLIKGENSNLNVIKLSKGSPVTRDFRFDRVRVFYDTHTNLVEGIPHTG